MYCMLYMLRFCAMRRKAADGSGSVVKERNSFSSEEGFVKNEKAGYHLLKSHESAVYFLPKDGQTRF